MEIIRFNNEVHRPSGPWTKQIHKFLSFLHKQGFNKVPKPLGFSEQGKERVTFLKGQTSDFPFSQNARSLKALISSAELLRDYHNVSMNFLNQEGSDKNWMFSPKTPQQVICHGDFAPYNICFIDEEAVGMIDFDTAHPGPRIWDIVYALYRFAPFFESTGKENCFGDLEVQIARARSFCDAYGLKREEREGITRLMIERLEVLVDFLISSAQKGNKKFQLNLQEGHHLKYLADIDYISFYKVKIESELN